MSGDRRVKGRSDDKVRAIAERTKTDFGVTRRRPVNILRCLESGSVLTVFGRKKLVFVVVDDDVLGTADAKTEYADGIVTITVKRSVRNRAELGMGRDRMTLAHELAHAVMHSGIARFRHAGEAGATALARISAYQSAEHQAKVFAAAFLIHDEDAAQMRDAQEIAVEFVVSLQAANLCFSRLKQKADRQRSAERIRKIADETIALLSGKSPSKPAYLDDPCASCHRPTLIAVGTKVQCDTCGFFGDRFQDGDSL